MSRVVAIDALFYKDPREQYQQKYLDREIVKAFAGFYPDQSSSEFCLPITTGHWGCGAFNGDRQFKGSAIRFSRFLFNDLMFLF